MQHVYVINLLEYFETNQFMHCTLYMPCFYSSLSQCHFHCLTIVFLHSTFLRYIYLEAINKLHLPDLYVNAVIKSTQIIRL